jgi:putative redox protein
MIIELNQQGTSFHFVAHNENNNQVSIDASPAIGGQNKGARPMELLIMGVGGCSGIDVISILEKQKIKVEGLKIKIDAQREEGVVPSLFKKIHLTFIFPGGIDKNKAQRAVSLSLEKYCSAAKTLEKTAEITHNIIIE